MKYISTNIEQTRQKIIDDPIRNMPSWTVAAFDPTKGQLPRRQTDPRGMELYFKALADAGAPGLLIASSTGWGHARTFDEHKNNVITAGKLEITNCIKQVLLRIEDPIEQNRDLLETIKSLDYGISGHAEEAISPLMPPMKKRLSKCFRW